jgi:acetyl esterase/lipase
VFIPHDVARPAPCLFWIPGGGHTIPPPDFEDDWCAEAAEGQGCIVVAVRWRPAPEHPFPAAIEDCYAALCWTVRSAGELGIDPARLVLGGRSSGGGSAAGIALMVRDRGEPAIAHQLLIYPMLDDRNTTASSHEIVDPAVWSRSDNDIAWRAYLGPAFGTDGVSPYAAPARAEDLSGLAPASILVGELDLFRDECITYAARLSQHGVPTDLHVYAGSPHGLEGLAPQSPVARRFIADRDAILREALAYPLISGSGRSSSPGR